MTPQELIEYWIQAAERDLPVIEHLFDKGDYVWSLFIAHLVIEKILKAHFVKANSALPPKTHDLIKISKTINLGFTEEQMEFLDLVNEFNIEARYPEEKFNFYKKMHKRIY
jgi:HEPN domain-containing protein